MNPSSEGTILELLKLNTAKYNNQNKEMQQTNVYASRRLPILMISCMYVEIKCQLDATASCKPDTQPSAPHQTSNLKTTARNTTESNHCIILLSS